MGAPANPLPSSLWPGRPVFLRTGIWATAAILAVAATGVATGSKSSGAAPSDPRRVGMCVQRVGSQFAPVDCSGPHFGKVVLITFGGGSMCPYSADYYARGGANDLRTYCVDSDV
ncbi:unannotated protein [freshwater metagenome]|uniref:Unannotated protein n=1 Tax=freshwater metagenome TaxID=449393 RepID=A0A6J7G4K5_9ZZZZ